MRCTQLIGLSPAATNYLQENGIIIKGKSCPTCGHTSFDDYDCKVYGEAHASGMFDDGPDLREYKLKDGSTVKEIVQATPWSSGPCIFLCLAKDGKRIGEWTEEEIDERL